MVDLASSSAIFLVQLRSRSAGCVDRKAHHDILQCRVKTGFDLATNVGVLPNRQHPIRVDLALDFPVDKKLFLKRNRALDFDVTRQSAFPSGGRIS